MKKTLKVIWAYTKNAMKISFEHPTASVAFLFGKLLRFGITGMFIYFILVQTKLLAGYTLQQTLLFFLTFNIVDSISQQLFREVYRFRPLILSGNFDMVLFKPVHPFTRVLVGGIDILDFIPTTLYVILIIWLLATTPLVTVGGALLYFAFVINALIIATAFHILVLAIGILSTEVDHTIMIYRDVTRMGLFPIDIYSEPIKSVLTFVVPVGIMMSFPVKAFLGMLTPSIMIISFGLGSLFFFISLYIWHNALLKYQSASS